MMAKPLPFGAIASKVFKAMARSMLVVVLALVTALMMGNSRLPVPSAFRTVPKGGF